MALLEEGLTVGEVSSRLTDAGGEPPDVAEFIRDLVRYGLVAAVDGRALDVPRPPAAGRRTLLARLRPQHARWLFSVPMLLVHAGIPLVLAGILLRRPDLLPTSRDMFVHPWYAVNTLIVVATAWTFVLLHELGHVVAARAMGVRASLSLGNRLFFLVSETHLSDVWQLRRRERLVIYLAGLVVNVWVLLLAVAFVAWGGSALPPAPYAWLKLVIVLQALATAWQFLFYMKTDVYFVLADLFHAKNLMGDAQALLRGAVHVVLPGWVRPAAPLTLSARERRFVLVYAGFYLVGVGLAAAMFVLYLLPFIIRTTLGAVAVLTSGPAAGIPRVTDAVVVLVAYGVSYGLVLRSWWRARTHRLRDLAIS